MDYIICYVYEFRWGVAALISLVLLFGIARWWK